jgi:hypothetical protein
MSMVPIASPLAMVATRFARASWCTRNGF